MRKHSRPVLVPLFSVLLLWSAGIAFAGEPYSDKDFSLRFPAAMTRFANYGDVAGMGGASAGSRWASAINPASTSWMEEPPRHLVLSGQYTALWFNNGQSFHLPAESVTVDLGKAGYLTGALAQIGTNRAIEDNTGLGFKFAGDLGQLAWAKKFTQDWAAGAAFTYTKSVARLSMDGFEVAKSNCDSYGLRGGLLKQVVKNLLAGIVVDYGWSSDRTTMVDDPPVRLCDATRQFLVRPGISYEYVKDGIIYLDYQYGTFWNDTGTLDANRIFAGTEYALTQWLWVRAGTAIDPTIGATAVTCGIGFYPTTWFSLDVGYQYDMFPELREEFGRSQALNFSIGLTF